MPVTRVDTEDILDGTILEEDIADGAIAPVKADLTASWDFGQGSGATLFYKTPTSDTEVAIKSYVDAIAEGIRDPKDSVYVAASGNITLSGLQSIDGVAGAQDDRVLVFGQDEGEFNGIYTQSTGSLILISNVLLAPLSTVKIPRLELRDLSFGKEAVSPTTI